MSVKGERSCECRHEPMQFVAVIEAVDPVQIRCRKHILGDVSLGVISELKYIEEEIINVSLSHDVDIIAHPHHAFTKYVGKA